MQKKLLGVAVAAALAAPTLALAQSSVQVYGTVNMSASQARFSSDTAGNLNSETKYGVTSHASNWGLRSTENLGGGMTAWFQAEFNMQMARNNGAFDGENTARNSGLGLRGAYGNIYVGTWETPWAQTFRMWDVGSLGGFGPTTVIIGRGQSTGMSPSRNCQNSDNASTGTGIATAAGLATTPICGNASTSAGGVGHALWRRYSYGIFYESPIWSGVQVKLAIQPNESKANFTPGGLTSTAGSKAGTTENPSSWSGSVAWTGMGGKARAFFSILRDKDWTSVGNTDSGWNIGGGYNFGPVDIGATYETMLYKTGTAATGGDARAKQFGLGAAIPAGPGKVVGYYAHASALSFSGTSPALNDTGAKQWGIGYEWTLSKRTALYGGIAKVDNGAQAAFMYTAQVNAQNGWQSGPGWVAGVDATNILVGMRHSF